MTDNEMKGDRRGILQKLVWSKKKKEIVTWERERWGLQSERYVDNVDRESLKMFLKAVDEDTRAWRVFNSVMSLNGNNKDRAIQTREGNNYVCRLVCMLKCSQRRPSAARW